MTEPTAWDASTPRISRGVHGARSFEVVHPTDRLEAQLVKRIWHLCEPDGERRVEHILPKGTAEVIVNLGDPLALRRAGVVRDEVLPGAFLNGVNTEPIQMVKTGRLELVGIQLSAVALRRLFGVPAVEFTDTVQAARDVDGELARVLDGCTTDESFDGRVARLRHWLLARLAPGERDFQMRRALAVSALASRGDTSVRRISEEVAMSSRQLQRICREWHGMAPHALLGYCRYLRSLELLHAHGCTLSRVALEAGYCDQPHFTREFRALTGWTPARYRAAGPPFPGHVDV